MAHLPGGARQGNRGGPQIEDLRERGDLRATVTPISSYDEKRPDFVAEPGRGPNKWARLAAALGSFNPELNNLISHQRQYFEDEQKALGKELMHRNKMDWNEFIKQNPDAVGKNPHFERGYKAADLTSRSQDFQAALQDFYTTGGLANETDPEKVREAVNAFGKKWTEENVPQEGFDAELYANNFLNHAQAAEGSVLSRHINDRADEHVKQAEEKYSQLFASTADTILDNTPNISNPEALQGALGSIASTAMQQIADMEANGVTRSRAHAIITSSIINLAKAEGTEGHGHELLALADHIKTGTGTLGGTPEFKAAARGLQDGWKNEQRQRNSEYIQMWNFNRVKAQEEATGTIGSALMDAYKNRKPIPDALTLMALPGVGPEHIDIANSIRNSFIGVTTYKPIMDQDSQVDLAYDHQQARLGKLTPSDALQRVGRYGVDEANGLYDIAMSAQSGNDPVSKALQGHGVQQALTAMEAQITALGGAWDKEESGILKARAIEAQGLLLDKIAVFVQEGEAKGRPRSAEEVRVFAREEGLKIGSEPLFRDRETPRDIQSPQTRKAMNTPEYWASNTEPHLGSAEEASNILWAWVRDPQAAAADIQIRCGVPLQMVTDAIINQADVYGYDLKGMLTQHQQSKTPNKQKREPLHDASPRPDV